MSLDDLFIDSESNVLVLKPEKFVRLNIYTNELTWSDSHNPVVWEDLEYLDFKHSLSLEDSLLQEIGDKRVVPYNLILILDNKSTHSSYHRSSSECDKKLEVLNEEENGLLSQSFRDEHKPAKDYESNLVQIKESLKDLVNYVRFIRFAGGEPFIQSSFTEVLDLFETHYNENIEVQIETSLNFEKAILKENLKKLEKLVKNNKIKKSLLVYMMDSFRQDYAELIRPGFDFKLSVKNFEFCIKKFDLINVEIQIINSIFSVDLIEEYKKFYLENEKLFIKFYDKITCSYAYHYYPHFLCMDKLPTNVITKIQEEFKNLKESIDIRSFHRYFSYFHTIKHFLINEVDRRENDSENIVNRSSLSDLYVFIKYRFYQDKQKFSILPKTLQEFYFNIESDFYHPDKTSQEQRVSVVKNELNKVSKTACLAKWYHSTIHLHIGQTHSCHHPNPHVIPLDEIKKSPKALHNTKFKKEQRKKMLEGERPSECHYCWRVEDTNKNIHSDRFLKSGENWAGPYSESLQGIDPNADVAPKYLEISFSSNCNLKCTYCHPFISKALLNEYKKFGKWPYEVFSLLEVDECKRMLELDKEDENPYVEAFWQWFPELYSELKVLRVTGGEPFLSKDTFKLLDYIKANPNENLELSINTNLTFRDDLIVEAHKKVIETVNAAKIQKLIIWASIDAHGEKAEYIRHGLNYNKFLENTEHLLKNDVEVQFMVTYNALSVTSFTDFLKDVLELKKKYPKKLVVSSSYLHQPDRQSVFILTEDFWKYMEESLEFMESHPKYFNLFEIHSFKRILEVTKNNVNSERVHKARALFFEHFYENDRRRGSTFIEVFPEMGSFWNLCLETREKFLQEKEVMDE